MINEHQYKRQVNDEIIKLCSSSQQKKNNEMEIVSLFCLFQTIMLHNLAADFVSPTL